MSRLSRGARPVPVYARVDGPPSDWYQLEVLLDGEPVKFVREVNTQEGWAIREVTDAEGCAVLENDEIKTERHEGAYALRWRERS